MKIGVVVTCRNAWEVTKQALPTFVSAVHDLFVCVVDDGSTDGTKKGLKAWQSEHKSGRWVMFDPPFASLAEKWNIGVQKCLEEGCDYVLVSNNDVLLHPTTIDTMVDRMEVGDVVMATAFDIQGTFTEKGIPPEFILMPECVLDDEVADEVEAPDFSCFMLGRECWEKVGQFDGRFTPAYFEDNDYHERILRAGLKAVNLPRAIYYHYGSVTRDADPAPDEEKHKAFELTRAQFFEKWGFHPGGNAAVGKMSKIKLLVVGDGDRPTGFARVVHAVCERLAATGDYDIHHLAINYYGDPPDVPWKMYPAHLSSPEDMFGRGRVRELYSRLEPDAVLMVQDPWHIADYVRSLRGMRGLTAYYPVDSPNLNPLWMAHLARCVEVCTYTQFGARESALASAAAFDQVIQDAFAFVEKGTDTVRVSQLALGSDQGQWTDPNFVIPPHRIQEMSDPGLYNVIPHGVDSEVFFQVDRGFARRRWGLGADEFVVGYVHRNQPRKRQDAMVRAFAKFIKGVRDPEVGVIGVDEIRAAPVRVKDARLVIHAAMEENSGWALPDLASAYGVLPWIKFTKRPEISSAISVEDLNLLFNTLDLNANLGGGEGWGLSHIESANCGVAQMVPDWSATAEIWTQGARKVPVKEVRHETWSLNTMQAVCDTDAAADAMMELYEDREVCRYLGGEALALVQQPRFTWDSVAGQFDEVLKRAATVKGVPHRMVTVTRRKDKAA